MAKKRLKQQTCRNCLYQFRIEAEHNNYCPNCGQENHDPRQPILHYLYELAETLVHFDSRTWNTFRTLLFKPGVITRDYIQNIRAKYTPPNKLFIFTLAIFIIFLEAAQDTMVKKDPLNLNNISLHEQMEQLPGNVRIAFSNPFFTGDKIYYTISELKEIKELDPSQIGPWLKSKNRYAALVNRLETRMVRNNILSQLSVKDYNRHIVRVHYWVLLAMMPISAFLIFLIFYRRGRLFYDAIIMSVHLYVFGLLVGILVTLAVLFLISMGVLKDTTIVLPLTMILSMVLNFIPAYKKVFDLSWPSTILRGLVVGGLNISVQILVFWLFAGYGS